MHEGIIYAKECNYIYILGVLLYLFTYLIYIENIYMYLLLQHGARLK